MWSKFIVLLKLAAECHPERSEGSAKVMPEDSSSAYGAPQNDKGFKPSPSYRFFCLQAVRQAQDERNRDWRSAHGEPVEPPPREKGLQA